METQTTSTILAGVLQGDTLAPYLFIICLDYVFRTFIVKMKENWQKVRPIQTIMDTDYTDECFWQMHPPHLKPCYIVWKEQNMCFNQRGDISTLNGSPVKLVDKFTYLGSSVSSTETGSNT